MIQITATDFKTNLGKYLSLVDREDIHITKNGADIAVLVAPKTKLNWVDDLTGIIPGADTDVKKIKTERLTQRYASLD
ncbi:MAG: type II toxin-antitoxin system Phd/YefM family antitoxin [Clostridiales Family XIII bacterium]|jgi:prevent-host-death family protein|nr:type II toxin-antitoxin system Phd/YefM family antitoxin [Clostridiales Family XIII bacterium]